MEDIGESRNSLMDPHILDQIRAIDASASDWIESRLAEHGFFDITVAEFSSSAGVDSVLCESILDVLADAGFLNREIRFRCPYCGEHVLPDDETCSLCGGDSLATSLVTQTSYQRSAPPGRDVAWMLLMHGMNTRGRWQEEFSWRAAVLHGRSIPIFSYKYGRIRPGVLLKVRRKQLVRRTLGVLRELAGDAESIHLGPRPDVIAHSFGTWLIVHALLEDSTMKIGRLILIGSIVPPNFEWGKISGQHFGVLNHVCRQDRVVGFAKYFIAESGPSGIVGFTDPNIERRTSESWGHSDCFKTKENLSLAFREIWGPFLTKPLGTRNAFE